jgi:trehalose synthase
MREVELQPKPVSVLEGSALAHDMQTLRASLDRAAERLEGRTLWHVNSTAEGGGVAELLHQLLGYIVGGGIACRWQVVEGTEDFFHVTKRIHNRLHGSAGDGGPLGDAERATYRAVTEDNLRPFLEVAFAGDVAVLHDPQTAGLVAPLVEAGLSVIWVCHVGLDEPNDMVRSAWDFLLPQIQRAHAVVFSRGTYVWDGLAPPVSIIPPCIDPTSPKNLELAPSIVHAYLTGAGVIAPSGLADVATDAPTVRYRAESVETALAPADSPLVVQISRWDRLKDHVGVLEAFAAQVDPSLGAHLLLAGPAAGSVDDDPEAAAVLVENADAWQRLPDAARERIHLISLPMDDPEENAFVVNALQRAATVVVQKSLAEGFGLTVAEAMWKTRPLVASRVGGIQDQIVDGVSGLLIDPHDPAAFGGAVTSLLRDVGYAEGIGHAGRERIRQHFLPTRFLSQHLDLVNDVLAAHPDRPMV